MGYSETLEAAGAKVLAFNEFGSYQGDWAALVEYNGETGFVFGSYGSCSGCDAFEAEFGWSDKPAMEDGKYYRNQYTWDESYQISKEEYDQKLAAYEKRFADFGRGYLTQLSDRNIIQTRLDNLLKDDWFSSEEREMLEWCLSLLDNQPVNQ